MCYLETLQHTYSCYLKHNLLGDFICVVLRLLQPTFRWIDPLGGSLGHKCGHFDMAYIYFQSYIPLLGAHIIGDLYMWHGLQYFMYFLSYPSKSVGGYQFFYAFQKQIQGYDMDSIIIFFCQKYILYVQKNIYIYNKKEKM